MGPASRVVDNVAAVPDLANGSGSPLEELAPGVFAWWQRPSGHGRTNAGLVIEDDGATVVDTLLTPSQAGPLHEAIERHGAPVRRAVLSSSHVEYVGGSSVFWMAARYGRSQTSALLDQPPNVEGYRLLFPEWADEFDDDFATRPISHVVDVAAWLTPLVCAVPTTGQMGENLVLVVPSADVLFAGAMCTFGTTPNAFDGDPDGWADALGDLTELATRIVPGIGPIGGADDVLALQAYLYACVDAEGDPTAIPSGPWDTWTDRHLDEINVERAAMLAAGDRSVPPSMLRAIGLS
jgi:glyoxylase-like metal-dependent hydrolase (beta-lactamase superfamily II)